MLHLHRHSLFIFKDWVTFTASVNHLQALTPFFPLFVNHIHHIYCCQADSKRYLPPEGPLQLKAKQAPDNPLETLQDINIPAVYQVRPTRGSLKVGHQGAQSSQVQFTWASLLVCLKVSSNGNSLSHLLKLNFPPPSTFTLPSWFR